MITDLCFRKFFVVPAWRMGFRVVRDTDLSTYMWMCVYRAATCFSCRVSTYSPLFS